MCAEDYWNCSAWLSSSALILYHIIIIFIGLVHCECSHSMELKEKAYSL